MNPPEPINILERSAADARRLTATGAPVYLFVNPVEYHGPHLSLHNDQLIAQGLARDLHAHLQREWPEWPMLVAGNLEAGAEPCFGPGSIHVGLDALRRLVLDACESLVALGARRVVLMTFHGAAMHNLALHEAALGLARQGIAALNPMNFLLRTMLEGDLDRFDGFLEFVRPEAREVIRSTLQFDFHAGFFETSLALHYAPDSVAELRRALPPCPPIVRDRALTLAAKAADLAGLKELARELRYAAFGAGWYAGRPFYAYTSRPSEASAEAGAFFARMLAEELGAVTQGVFEGHRRAPEPVLSWLVPLTLKGRLFLPKVLLSDMELFTHLGASSTA